MDDAALAGGWRGSGVYEKHYAEALRHLGPEDPVAGPPEEPEDYWPGNDGNESVIPTPTDPARAAI